MACSARLASSTGPTREDGGEFAGQMGGSSNSSSSGGGLSISRLSRASSRPRAVRGRSDRRRRAGLRRALGRPTTVGMNVLEMLTASAQVLTPELAVGVTAVDLPPVAHEHAVEVGPQDRLRVFESAARADGVDGRRRGDGRPQPVAAGADAPTGLIGRDHRSVADLLAQRLVGRRRVRAARCSRCARPPGVTCRPSGSSSATLASGRPPRGNSTTSATTPGPIRVGGLQRGGGPAADTASSGRPRCRSGAPAGAPVFLILCRRAGHLQSGHLVGAGAPRPRRCAGLGRRPCRP